MFFKSEAQTIYKNSKNWKYKKSRTWILMALQVLKSMESQSICLGGYRENLVKYLPGMKTWGQYCCILFLEIKPQEELNLITRLVAILWRQVLHSVWRLQCWIPKPVSRMCLNVFKVTFIGFWLQYHIQSLSKKREQGIKSKPSVIK